MGRSSEEHCSLNYPPWSQVSREPLQALPASLVPGAEVMVSVRSVEQDRGVPGSRHRILLSTRSVRLGMVPLMGDTRR